MNELDFENNVYFYCVKIKFYITKTLIFF